VDVNSAFLSREVYNVSRELFDELWDGVTPLRLLGIALTNVTREDTQQISLFPDEDRERSRRIDRTRDALNAKFGTHTLIRGSAMGSELNVGKKYKAQLETKNGEGEK